MSMRTPTRYVSSNDAGGVQVNSLVVTTAPTKVLTVFGYNAGPAQFIQLFFKGAVPAANAVPSFPSVPVPAAGYWSIELGQHGIDVDALTIVNSTTDPGYTPGAANCEIIAILGS